MDALARDCQMVSGQHAEAARALVAALDSPPYVELRDGPRHPSKPRLVEQSHSALDHALEALAHERVEAEALRRRVQRALDVLGPETHVGHSKGTCTICRAIRILEGTEGNDIVSQHPSLEALREVEAELRRHTFVCTKCGHSWKDEALPSGRLCTACGPYFAIDGGGHEALASLIKAAREALEATIQSLGDWGLHEANRALEAAPALVLSAEERETLANVAVFVGIQGADAWAQDIRALLARTKDTGGG